MDGFDVHEFLVVFDEAEDMVLLKEISGVGGNVVVLQHINHLSLFLLPNINNLQNVTLSLSDPHLHAHFLHVNLTLSVFLMG